MATNTNHEQYLRDVIPAVLSVTTGAVFDVGVNRGQTLLKLLEISTDIDYHGFEPQVGALYGVQYFLNQNKLNNFKVYPVALGLSNTVCTIKSLDPKLVGQLSSPVASMIDGFRPEEFYNFETSIVVVKGDEIVESLEIDKLGLIKIDVEGAELEVVAGLEHSIRRLRPIILFEVLHHFIAVSKQALDDETKLFRTKRILELEALIRSFGYRILQIIGNAELCEVDKIRPKEVNELSTTDYLAVPAEKVHDIARALSKTRKVSLLDSTAP
ncbi:FkbM family methyltransferase [Arenicella chitinivorans]|nr:FkbM family methyltransferase [Arenicella chitinivorans]